MYASPNRRKTIAELGASSAALRNAATAWSNAPRFSASMPDCSRGAHRGGRKAPPIAVARESTSTAARESWLHRFLNHDELIGLYAVQDLTNARGPANFDVCRLRGAKAKMQTFVVRREIASRSRREASLTIDLNASTETVAIAAFSAQRDCQPVKLAAAIEIKLRGFAKRSRNNVHPAVVVQITERRTATGHGHVRSGVGSFETTRAVHG